VIDRVGAIAALQDPRTPAGVLFEIAQGHPDLWVALVDHPNTYPGLLDWLASRGDPHVLAAIQDARARSMMQPAAVPMDPSGLGMPPAGMPPQAYPTQPEQMPPQMPMQPQMPAQAYGQPSEQMQPIAQMPMQEQMPPQAYGQPGMMQYYPAPYPVPPGQHPNGGGQFLQQGKATVQKAFDSITGYEGEAILKFKDLFRDTFKKHSRADMDALMYSGTEAALYDRQWRLPWLYSRVFGVLLGANLILWLCMAIFSDTSGNVVPGVIFTGALVVPATIMVFFWEFNQAKNLSFFDVVRIFFIGGALSLLLTFVVSAVTEVFTTSGYGIGGAFIQAIFIGFAEEAAKLIAVVILVRKLYGCLISNGLLVGAIVGTGFAVFETMGYGTTAWVRGNMEMVLLLRGMLSVGGHIVWTAIAGAALMLAQAPGSRQISLKNMAWGKFLALFAVPFALHMLWDFFAFTIHSEAALYILFAVLIVVAWVFIVRLINTGLRQYAELLGQPAQSIA